MNMAEVHSPAGSGMMLYDASKKSTAVSYLLWFFLVPLGAHRFYNGRAGTGALMLALWIIGVILIFAGGLGFFLLLPVSLWLLVDAFLIPGWTRNHNIELARSLGA